ncbi:peptide hydrolase-6 [Coleophoma crateriformis]|uniref:Peptide hydrolase n=1 Tax=Coleophoma crateriformis TaxID=565419 RepID=A0A3D8SAA5_9HELO|nr:peptide hydrolase-6 [Coleophoma crateriformis]
MRVTNPLSFTPKPVTILTTFIYLAVFIPLLIVHETVPPAPKSETPRPGINLTEAWLDLQELSSAYHPFNSRRNDVVRNWLLKRIGQILDENHAPWKAEGLHYESAGEFEAVPVLPFMDPQGDVIVGSKDAGELRARDNAPTAIVFNDLLSNYTSNAITSKSAAGRRLGISTYFEGNNIIVYVRGSEDEEGDWWSSKSFSTAETHGKGGVMVNAHFDSVATGYGATDDGVGVITVLQLLKYFSHATHTPKKGIVLLLNNGEEDGLYGAKAFLSHPMASFVHTFLNLEGAGAGGRATLFRSTDTEVTRAYGKSPHPFGTVLSSDGFSLGFVRSETDYVIFRAEGYRGLDVAFWEPRSQYHTNQDSTKYTSKDSLWHMLSASIATVESLSSDTSSTFEGPRGDNADDKVKNGKGSDVVFFDLFGAALAVFRLRTLFAWSLSLLIASPLILILVSYILARQGKYYLFSATIKPDVAGEDPVPVGGWKGAFRFPIVLVICSALTIGSAFLIRKVNPLIIFSSSYSVWAMSLSLFYISFWFLMAGCNFIRPSALHREYALMWIFVIGWGLLVVATVYEDRFRISSGYLFVIYESAVFLAALIGLLEFFALPTKSAVAEIAREDSETQEGIDALPRSDALLSPANGDDHDDATETTPLVGDGEHRRSLGTTFADRYRRSTTATTELEHSHGNGSGKHLPFGGEQAWSAKLPAWTWVLQFLLMGPFVLIVLGQVGLLIVTALDQTGTDGSPLLLPYLVVALFSILLFLPVTPFMHRITHHIPAFLFLVFVGTLIYNLVAFPFSPANRYKAYFQQRVDLESGINRVEFAGLESYIRELISHIPSATGQEITCATRANVKDGLSFCSYEGPAPNVINNTPNGVPPEKGYKDWLTYNVTRTPKENKARFHISGLETRACLIRFTTPFRAFHVHGAASHGKFGGDDVPESGSDQIKLWSRDWDHEWVVDVEWAVSEGKQPGDEGIEGKVVCLWSDFNDPTAIPALDEAKKFVPPWSSIVKTMDGLVEGSKPFVV